MYVLKLEDTNLNGSSVLLNNAAIEATIAKIEDPCVILPSSRDEIIIVKIQPGTTCKYVTETINFTNKNSGLSSKKILGEKPLYYENGVIREATEEDFIRANEFYQQNNNKEDYDDSL